MIIIIIATYEKWVFRGLMSFYYIGAFCYNAALLFTEKFLKKPNEIKHSPQNTCPGPILTGYWAGDMG
jgi:hypothetical protein